MFKKYDGMLSQWSISSVQLSSLAAASDERYNFSVMSRPFMSQITFDFSYLCPQFTMDQSSC